MHRSALASFVLFASALVPGSLALAQEGGAADPAAPPSVTDGAAAPAEAADAGVAGAGEAAPAEDGTAPAPAIEAGGYARPATVQIVPALLMAYGAGATDNFSAGLQLRLDVHPTERFPLRTGGYVTGEFLADGTVRVAGGLSGGLWLIGCRVGLAYRTETPAFASSLGLEIGKSVDFMGFSIGGRLTIPLVDFVSPNASAQRVQGVEGQVFLTVGWPVGLDGPARPGCGCPHRRHAPSEAPAPIEEGGDGGEAAASGAAASPTP